ncbi:hypothetical protein thsrh120_62740 [Rhizobium sp. No.120]
MPGEKLAAMGVAGQLKCEARLYSCRGGAWLMREKKPESDIARSAPDRFFRVALMSFIETPCLEVGHASDQRTRSVVIYDHVLVHQYLKPKPTHLIDP